MIINTSSGSYYPTNILNEQLERKQEHMRTIACCDGTNTCELSGEVVVDLPRLGKLIVNNQDIYSSLGNVNMDDEIKAEAIFQKIERIVGSTSSAISISHLCHQGLIGHVLPGVLEQKNISLNTHKVSSKETVNIFNQERNNNFKFIHEDFIETYSHEEMINADKEDRQPNRTYFKIKTIVSGKLSDLDNCRGDNLKIETAYTKERPSQEKARTDNYFGTMVGGFCNTESYIK